MSACTISTSETTEVDELVAARQLPEAAGLAQSLLAQEGLAPITRARLGLTLSSLQFCAGSPRDACAAADAVIATPGLPDELVAAGEFARLLSLLALDDLSGARELASGILAGTRHADGDDGLVVALSVFALIAWDEGRVADALGLARAAARRADALPAERRHTHVRLVLAGMLTTVGELDEAERCVRTSQDEIERSGNVPWAAAPAVFGARIHLAAGRYDAAALAARAGLDLTDELGTRLFAPQLLSTLATVALLRGDLRAAAQHIADLRAEPLSPRLGFGVAGHGLIEARVCAARDGAERALQLFAPVYDELFCHKRVLLEAPGAAAWLVRTALAAGDRHRAALVVTCADQLAVESPEFTSVIADAMHARALFHRDAARLDEAAGTYADPWAHACAAEDAAAARADTGECGVARDQFQAALGVFERVGARADAERVRGRLRSLTARRRNGRRHRPVDGWASLTEGELRVVDHVARGMTNREVAASLFLSRHTVDFHLRQAYRKLNVSSRVQLTRLALEHRDGRPLEVTLA